MREIGLEINVRGREYFIFHRIKKFYFWSILDNLNLGKKMEMGKYILMIMKDLLKEPGIMKIWFLANNMT